jgi:ClpP class serine protease
MRTTTQILFREKRTAELKGQMTWIHLHQLLGLADELGKYDEAIEWLKKTQFQATEKEAKEYMWTFIQKINEAMEEDENDFDPNDPDSWDCDEDEYIDRYSDLVNRAHEASEGDR